MCLLMCLTLCLMILGGGRYLLAVDTQVQTTFYKMHFVKRKISGFCSFMVFAVKA